MSWSALSSVSTRMRVVRVRCLPHLYNVECRQRSGYLPSGLDLAEEGDESEGLIPFECPGPADGAWVATYHGGEVDNAAETAKLPEGWHLHDLRHRRVTTWLAEGKSPVLVKEALGHRDLRTTMGYYRFVLDHLRALVEPNPATAGHMQDIAGA